MALTDLLRVRSNVQALELLHNLRQVNTELAIHQLRLGTGRRINSAMDDPAGLTLATKLESSQRVWGALYDNAGQARSMLAVAEGGLLEISDILGSMTEKIIAAASDTIGQEERDAILDELSQLSDEIDDIAAQTSFNGKTLLSEATTFRFQTGPNSQTTWTSAAYDTLSLGMALLGTPAGASTINPNNYTEYVAEIENAQSTVSAALTGVGALENRLLMKEEVISVIRNNTVAAYNRIMNADMAEEQIEVTKYRILQQTSIAMLAQANANATAIYALFEF